MPCPPPPGHLPWVLLWLGPCRFWTHPHRCTFHTCTHHHQSSVRGRITTPHLPHTHAHTHTHARAYAFAFTPRVCAHCYATTTRVRLPFPTGQVGSHTFTPFTAHHTYIHTPLPHWTVLLPHTHAASHVSHTVAVTRVAGSHHALRTPHTAATAVLLLPTTPPHRLCHTHHTAHCHVHTTHANAGRCRTPLHATAITHARWLHLRTYTTFTPTRMVYPTYPCIAPHIYLCCLSPFCLLVNVPHAPPHGCSWLCLPLPHPAPLLVYSHYYLAIPTQHYTHTAVTGPRTTLLADPTYACHRIQAVTPPLDICDSDHQTPPFPHHPGCTPTLPI